MEQDILDTLNKAIREEHGTRVNIESLWPDAEVDSFGTNMVFMEMDEKYGCFNNEWFLGRTKEEWMVLPIREIVERVMNEGTIV